MTAKSNSARGPEVAAEVGQKYWLGKQLGSDALCATYGISHTLLLKWAREYCKAHPECSKTGVIAK